MRVRDGTCFEDKQKWTKGRENEVFKIKYFISHWNQHWHGEGIYDGILIENFTRQWKCMQLKFKFYSRIAVYAFFWDMINLSKQIRHFSALLFADERYQREWLNDLWKSSTLFLLSHGELNDKMTCNLV